MNVQESIFPITPNGFAGHSMDDLMQRWLLAQLQATGILADGRAHAFDALAGRVQPLYRRWLEESLRLLRDAGLVRDDAQGWRAAERAPIDARDAQRHWDASRDAWLADRERAVYVVLIEAVLAQLPAILTGRRRATDVLFPNGSMARVQGVYTGNHVSDHFNRVLVDHAVRYVAGCAARRADAKLRFIEVGAGTGGTTEGLLAALAPHARHVGEYCFTDISKAFLNHAQRRFGEGAPFFGARVLDIEQPIDAQGFEPGAYDALVATNVLHATRDIRTTLRHCKALLKHNGLLFINEMTGSVPYLHLTFGMLEGWWRFTDDALRVAGCPAVAPQTWDRVLREEGFSSVIFPARDAHGQGQQIVIAQNDARRAGSARRDARASNGDAQHGARHEAAHDAQHDASGDTQADAHGSAHDSAHAAAALRREGRAYLRARAAELLGMPAGAIDPDEGLHAYGLDSILASQFAAQLAEAFDGFDGALLFEHKTINALLDHLLAAHADALARLLQPAGGAPARAQTAQASGEGRDATCAGTRDAPPAAPHADARSDTPSSAPAQPDRPASSVPPAQPAQPAPRADTPPPAASAGHRGEARASDTRYAPRAPHADAAAEPVAIIGISGRYPGAYDVPAFWRNLLAGACAITEVPAERWDWRAHYRADAAEAAREGKSYSKWGGFVDDVGRFDPAFFGMTPQDAQHTDPQELLFLEMCWHALQDAGQTPALLPGDVRRRAGVFAAITKHYAFPPTSFASLANRVSHALDFGGKSLAIDTMCSSSLVAVNEAWEYLQRDGRLAVVGGVNLYLDPQQYAHLSRFRFASSGPVCKAFGEGGDGFVPGEGAGAIVLKRLSDAERDGDPIHAVIRGCAVNHNGRSTSFTASDPARQADVVRDALTRAGVDPRTIGYVEAAANGHAMGDAIEMTGLGKVFAACDGVSGTRAIGSVKANIGHCEAASGMSQLTKVVMAMRDGVLAPTLRDGTRNPNIAFERLPFEVQEQAAPWRRLIVDGNEVPRRAGVTSIGGGGVNAHVVLEEYVAPPRAARPGAGADDEVLFVLSARTREQLGAYAERWAGYLEAHPDCDVDAIAHTVRTAREPMAHRLA
ncbi:beta-ketoacyl synthase N-terminal-like domain-containing protein, partial [Burkholderia thailandensis]